MHPEIELAIAHAKRDAAEAAQTLQEQVRTHLDAYEFTGESGVHVPTDFERAMLHNCVQGLLADEAFRSKAFKMMAQQRFLASLNPEQRKVVSHA